MMTFEESVNIHRPIEAIFDFIADGEKADRWNSAVKKVEKISDGPIGPRTRFHMVRDLPWGRVENDYEVAEYVPYSSITIRTISGPTPFVYRYTLIPTKGGIRLTLEGEGDTSDITHIPGFIMKIAVKQGVRENLEKLKDILES